MIKEISKEEIDMLHILHMIERKTAILVNLQLIAEGKYVSEKNEKQRKLLEEKYGMDGNIQIGQESFPKQFRLSNYFRGENAWYPNGKVSLFRNLPDDNIEREQFLSEEKAHLNIFSERLQRKNEGGNDYETKVYPGLLYQHYGNISDWQAFTSNFDEALFYACCVYENEKWRPLNREEIQLNHKQGVIYCGSMEDERFYHPEEKSINCGVMFPAGSQPFMRCSTQYSYAMQMGAEDDLRNDQRFDCLIFEHTEKLCQEIFDKMCGGQSLYQRDAASIGCHLFSA
ncbi:Uncharacterised protein [uncultured Roseburia sp.]|uniref:Uncharacterized protein n=1 Tax=Brotonthovivens ammoniilytica TaxID=2981725 RepID=A0ABT2TLY7_9FIRM|nr:hypothetical protein [Brotonthovivens ammoniilytica]MCU6763235.1 hypothetical protein [Brotonthovivens ammoniilytica]SCJ07854.1 Uncharacterised protein [uncultured Roseburia sp.]